MCQAHILRFCCGHGILMSIDTCNLGPCPVIKTTGVKLPQQPYRCYNCQYRRSSLADRPPSNSLRGPSNTSSAGSLDSERSSCSSSSSSSSSSISSTSSSSSVDGPPSPPLFKTPSRAMAPLPGVAFQPSSCIQYGTSANSNAGRPRSSTANSSNSKPFTFTCCTNTHSLPPHYTSLPSFLPHQMHPCPPCQLSALIAQSDCETAASAAAAFPHLRSEMLVRNGRVREDWQSTLTLEGYVEERRTEEREMWLHVSRKWTQDLKRLRVLVAEEDGLGLWS